MENPSIRSRRPAAARIAEPNRPAYNFGRQAGRRAHEAAGDAWIRMPAGENGEVMVKEDVARKLGKRLADKVQELRSLLDERS